MTRSVTLLFVVMCVAVGCRADLITLVCDASTQSVSGSCSPTLTYEAFVYLDSPGFATKTDTVDTWLTLQVTDGPAGLPNGFFVPCLIGNSFFVPPYSATGFARLDGVGTNTRTCGTGALNPANAIAFTFDEPQTLELLLSAGVIIGRNGGSLISFASFDGFELYDPSGQRIAAVVNVGVPEPSSLTLLGAGLLSVGLCAIGRRKIARS